MGEYSDFQNVQRKKRGCGIIAIVVLIIVAISIYFTAGEFKSSGIFRSGKNSDATSLYQLYPYQKDGKNYFISVEGVFKTRIYERQGGMTTRSGSTDIRVSIHDLESGDLINKTVTGDYHEAMTKILGNAGNAMWFYDMENGLHTKTFPELAINITEEKIIASNTSLNAGLAKTDTYLNNIDDLYGINETENAIMVTTISGNTVWIDAVTLQTIQEPLQHIKKNSFNEEVDRIVEQAKSGGTIDMSYLNDLIKNITTDIASSNIIGHAADQAMGADSCIYRFDGSIVKTLQKTDCPKPLIIQTKQQPDTFIEPVFISDYNTTDKQYVNPEFLSADACMITHASKMGDKSELLLSKLDAKTHKPLWTTKTEINLSNHRSSYSINGLFDQDDTLFITVDHQIFAVNLLSGKILWKYKIDNANYNDYLYFTGIAKQNNKTYLLTANSYFTELSRSGIFITGRTDFRLQCIDTKTGKLIKKMEMEGGDSKDLPYYLGMSNNVCWFYTDKDGIHTRSIPDLKIITPFSAIKKNLPAQSELISTTRFSDAQNNNYVTLDEKNNAIYFITQNGLYYSVNTNTLQLNEIQSPSSTFLENCLQENSNVSFYKTQLQNMYHHDLVMQDGAIIKIEKENSIGKIIRTEKKSENEKENATQLASNQFIEGSILMNGVSITGNTILYDTYRTPLALINKEKALYILHKDKIAPDAHVIISRYNTEEQTITWRYDVSANFSEEPELERIYTEDNKIIFIFKTSPDLDDIFTCVAIDGNSGKEVWKFIF